MNYFNGCTINHQHTPDCAQPIYDLFASELLSPGSACPAYQVRLAQYRIANRIDTEVQS